MASQLVNKDEHVNKKAVGSWRNVCLKINFFQCVHVLSQTRHVGSMFDRDHNTIAKARVVSGFAYPG